MSSPEKDLPYSKNMHPLEGIPAGQEPTVMPGFTAPVDQDIVRSTADQQVLAAPLGSYDRLELEPWPSLSREQVVELHCALCDWSRAFKPALTPAECLGRMQTQLSADESLLALLQRLGIGTPPKTKRWSEDQLQQAVEEVQTFQDAQSAADGLMARVGLPRHVLSPGPSSATEIAITSAMEASLATPKARRQEGAWEEPARKNCWTCKHKREQTLHCNLLLGVGEMAHQNVAAWRTQMLATTNGRLTDNCPGWEQKP